MLVWPVKNNRIANDIDIFTFFDFAHIARSKRQLYGVEKFWIAHIAVKTQTQSADLAVISRIFVFELIIRHAVLHAETDVELKNTVGRGQSQSFSVTVVRQCR